LTDFNFSPPPERSNQTGTGVKEEFRSACIDNKYRGTPAVSSNRGFVVEGSYSSKNSSI